MTILPANPPLVVPFKVITSLVAPEIKVLPVASSTPVYNPPTNLSVPSVLISRSVAAVTITNVKDAPKLFNWFGSVGSLGVVVTIEGRSQGGTAYMNKAYSYDDLSRGKPISTLIILEIST